MTIAATYADGRVVRVNMAKLAQDLQVFAPLESPNEFASVKVTDWGWTLEWDCGASLDSDRLIELSLEQSGMSANVQCAITLGTRASRPLRARCPRSV